MGYLIDSGAPGWQKRERRRRRKHGRVTKVRTKRGTYTIYNGGSGTGGAVGQLRPRASSASRTVSRSRVSGSGGRAAAKKAATPSKRSAVAAPAKVKAPRVIWKTPDHHGASGNRGEGREGVRGMATAMTQGSFADKAKKAAGMQQAAKKALFGKARGAAAASRMRSGVRKATRGR